MNGKENDAQETEPMIHLSQAAHHTHFHAEARRGSLLDAPPVSVHDKNTHKEAKERLKERRASVKEVAHVVAVANQKQKEADTLNDLKQEVTMDEHMMSVEVLAHHLEVNLEFGLTDAVVTHRLIRDGPNALPVKKELPGWVLWVMELTQGFSILLWVGAILSIIAYIVQSNVQPNTPMDNLYLGVVLICVVFITGTFSYAQQSKSASIMNSFLKMAPQFAAVVRNGEKIVVMASELVVGDVVEIKAGDKIPADIRLTENRGLKVDNASLTGESEPLSRTVEGTHDNPLETRNLAFFSTYAVEGSAIGIVVRTGERTIMGRIAQLASTVETDITPLAQEMHRFVIIMTSFAAVMGALCFFIALGQGQSFLTAIIFLIGIIVANVPEGILPATTVALALTAKKMAGMNCLVKSLSAVETLGSTSVICSDKTGTLTQNRMTVSHLWADNTFVASDTTEDQSLSKLDTSSLTVKALVRCALLCNRAAFKLDQDKVSMMKRETIGDASESALLKFTEVNLGNTMDHRLRNKKVAEIPFNSTNKYQLSVHESEEDDGTYLLVMKGAAERIVDRCSNILMMGKL